MVSLEGFIRGRQSLGIPDSQVSSQDSRQTRAAAVLAASGEKLDAGTLRWPSMVMVSGSQSGFFFTGKDGDAIAAMGSRSSIAKVLPILSSSSWDCRGRPRIQWNP